MKTTWQWKKYTQEINRLFPPANTFSHLAVFRWSWKYQDSWGFIPVHSGCARFLPWRRHCHYIQQPDWGSRREGGRPSSWFASILEVLKQCSQTHHFLTVILSLTAGTGWLRDEHLHAQVSATGGRGPHLSDVISGCRGDPHSQGTATPGQTRARTDLPHGDQDLKGGGCTFSSQTSHLLVFLCYFLSFLSSL